MAHVRSLTSGLVGFLLAISPDPPYSVPAMSNLTETTETITVQTEAGPVGPYVEYSDEDDFDDVEAALPEGWGVDWEAQVHVRKVCDTDYYRAPLRRTIEPLTDDMIHALRDEAAARGDNLMVDSCDMALASHGPIHFGREQCAKTINDARTMDDSKPFVRVVADEEVA